MKLAIRFGVGLLVVAMLFAALYAYSIQSKYQKNLREGLPKSGYVV